METNTLVNNDITREILSYLTTYEQLSLCQTNKNINLLCNTFNIKVLANNLKYNTFACNTLATFYIKNNKLYKILLLYGSITEIELPNNDIPISITSCGYNGLLIITNLNKLYFYSIDLEQINVPGQILYVTEKICDFYIITSLGLYEYSFNDKTYTKIDIDNPLFVRVASYKAVVITPKGCFSGIDNIQFTNIDGINDILDADVGYLDIYILTTTGLYKNTEKINLPFENKIKCIRCSLFETFLLTDNGLLYVIKNGAISKLNNILRLPEPIKEIMMDKHIIIATDIKNNYYRITTKYNVNTAVFDAKKLNI